MPDNIDPHDQPPSKSQLKRDADALQQLGIDLLDVPESAWITLELPEGLLAALREAKRLHARGAHKRQLQYIGKLMRNVDPEPIQQYFEQRRLEARQHAQAHHALEDWRDHLIEDGDPAIEAFMLQHEQADRQHLRQLIRQANKERAQNKPPKASRALFRYLRDLQG